MDHRRKALRLSALSLLLSLLLSFSACDNPVAATNQGQGTEFNPALGASDLTHYVNPLIGTAPGGNRFGFGGNSGDTFPGATYPFGMVSWSPDTPSNLPGGYNYQDSSITGFSLTHFSGRGCLAYQDIPFMPYVGALSTSPGVDRGAYASAFSHSSEQAHPGYYGVHLDGPNVDVALTATQRTGMARFTYPASQAATLLVNTSGSVKGNSMASASIYSGGQEISGSATSTIGCGNAPYTLYFAAHFDQPFKSFGTWNAAGITPGSSFSDGSGSGAYVTFDTTAQQSVQVRVGISYVSVENARANLQQENDSSSFASVLQAASTAWSKRLNTIQVQGGSEQQKEVFYTALYHTFFHPNIFSDVNGQYLGFDRRVHTTDPGHVQYHDIPAWDQYRSLAALRAILAPQETSDVVRSLINDARQGDGHLPRWEQVNADSYGMNGDGADAWIANAQAFGASNFDLLAAFKAMDTGQSKIREGLSDYLKLGYVAHGTTLNDAAVTEEYSIDDFSIAQVARSLGKKSAYLRYLARSGSWQRIFNQETGYIQPRDKSGNWIPNFSVTSQNGFQEGDSAQYSWMVPFNVHGLFNAMGGDAAVVSRLDQFFAQLNDGPNSQYAFMGNEPSFEIPWEYDFAGAPSHTQQVVRRIQTELFHATPGGLPGNDDGGSMSAWYVFSALGLYPEIPGVGGFVIGSPVFSSASVQLGGGHSLTINAQGAAENAPYVQSLTVNGQTTSQLWLPWDQLKQGATLNFVTGTQASNWGMDATDAPPSFPPAVIIRKLPH